jgi:hypothetical protein
MTDRAIETGITALFAMLILLTFWAQGLAERAI